MSAIKTHIGHVAFMPFPLASFNSLASALVNAKDKIQAHKPSPIL